MKILGVIDASIQVDRLEVWKPNGHRNWKAVEWPNSYFPHHV
jgi:hypothetical protein